MNELEYDFEFVSLICGGAFTPSNRARYEEVVRRRGKEGWQLCQSSLVTAINEEGKNPTPAMYLTFIKAADVMRKVVNDFMSEPINLPEFDWSKVIRGKNVDQ